MRYWNVTAFTAIKSDGTAVMSLQSIDNNTTVQDIINIMQANVVQGASTPSQNISTAAVAAAQLSSEYIAIIQGSRENCDCYPEVTPQSLGCASFEAQPQAEQDVICNSCATGNIPSNLAQLCDCCPETTTPPVIPPVAPMSKAMKPMDKGMKPMKPGMKPMKPGMKPMMEQVERLQKLANIKKKK